jgi:predicted Fe-S protein YdhL (DUF1289 family)
MTFSGWTHIEIMAWLSQNTEAGRKHVIKLVEKRLNNENN